MDEIQTQTTLAQNPVPPEMTFWDKVKLFYVENKWAVWLIVITLLITGVFLFFAFWSPGSKEVKPNVTVELEVPNQLSSGSEIIYKVNFKNHERDLIRDISLDMVYPSGFTFKDSVPETSSLNGTRFNLPNVEPGQEGTVMIKGMLVGNIDEMKSVSALMRYKFSQFNSEFVVQSQGQTRIVNSDILLQFEGPFRAPNGQDITYNLSYANNSDKDLNELKLKMDLPAVFRVVKQDPPPTQGAIWNIGGLKANERKNIQFVGQFQGTKAGEEMTLRAQIDGLDDTGREYTLASTSYIVTISQQPLVTEISVRNASNLSTDIVFPGESLDYRIKYQNNDASAAHGVIITAKLNGEALDLSTIEAPQASIQGNTIIWNASQVRNLGTLEPNQGGEVTFRITIKNPATRDSVKNLVVSADAAIKSYEYDQAFISPAVKTNIGTVVKLDTAVEHKSGFTPPSVGKDTTYRVTMDLKNASNDVEGSIMSFNLPSSLDFDMSAVNAEEAKNVTYDRNSRKVTWNIGRLPAHIGILSAPRRLEFDVSITPAAANARKPMTLVNNIKFNATDSFTKQVISINAQDISTLQDKSGNGIVGGF